jgi:acyl-CoA thioester hydrolase
MEKYVYELEMSVRDYELDSEGIVNNANYLHYLEHTRHEFCSANGISFAEMQNRGIIPVLNRVEIDYKAPLRSGDCFVSKLWLERRGVRFVFHQDLFKLSGETVVSAVVSCVCLENGKLDRGDMLAEIFKDFL